MATRYKDGTFKLDMKQVEANFRSDLKEKGGRKKLMSQMKALQVVVYVMVGGGMLGSFAAHQPKSFYIDSRVSKRPYKQRHIYQSVAVLSLYAKVLKLNPNDMPRMEFCHSCGVF